MHYTEPSNSLAQMASNLAAVITIAEQEEDFILAAKSEDVRLMLVARIDDQRG